MNNLENAIEKAKQVVENFQHQFLALEKSFEKVAEGFRKIREELPEAMIELSNLGWYTHLDSDPWFPINLKDQLKSGNVAEVDTLMIEYLDQVYTGYKKEILNHFSKRKLPLKAGFSAHEREEYFLSIPVFFAQIEGMCFDQIGERYFSIKKGAPKTKKYVEQLQRDSFMETLFSPLKEVGPYRKNQDSNNPVGINRHDVLHGDSVDYGTKINGYKVLSLLFYISEINKFDR